MKINSKEVIQNRLGYFELAQKPSEGELQQYYAEKYYQYEHSNYAKTYPEDELKYFRAKIAQKYLALKSLSGSESGSLLDVGCGEGFTLAFFKEMGWQVTGVDYSRFGCQQMNPHCLDDLLAGDIYLILHQLIEQHKTYDLLWISNVLEHVLDPLALLRTLQKLVSPAGYLIVQVPNDFSFFQNYLLQAKIISEPFWVAVPDHISYFTRTSLKRLCLEAGWSEQLVLADFPIDLFLLNEHSNYHHAPEKGKAAHLARVKLENLFHAHSPERTNRFYQAMAELDFGRQITGFYTLKPLN
ncbi:MAG: class I SAM-dependent methyltransferase [Candidatus Sericytochromatia bacterium]|nr:class I SAM-dependent methyltransferase [Candidatus Sericytochromatia bacterium]